VPSQHPGYSLADGPSTLSWSLLYSRTAAGKLPLARFELTEEEPCVISGVFKIRTNPIHENVPDRTKDTYVNTCPVEPLETTLENTFRSASSTITMNERTWLD